MRPLLAQDSESGGVSQTRWAPVLAQHLCRGSKEVALVIFKCLEPLIETSEAVAPATPRPLGMCPGVELGRSPRGSTCPLPGRPHRHLLGPGLSHPVAQPPGDGDSSPEMGPGPSWLGHRTSLPSSGGQNTLHLESDNIRCWGEASFSLFFQMFGKTIEKERGGEGPQR